MVESVTDRCLCGASTAHAEIRHGLPMLECTACGVMRQHVPLTHAQLQDWYETEYVTEGGAYTHSYGHDREVARLRLEAYNLPASAKLLDVGAGNGAFVDECVERGIDAWGQDLTQQPHGLVWRGPLEQVAFPAHTFDVVTMHDVLEHVPDPMATLHEVARTLRTGGRFLLDFPRFHHSAGEHHWKRTEHLWMLHDMEVRALLEKCGFAVDAVEHPIPSKSVFYARNTRTADKLRILVPPGIGDGYWVLAKLRGILEAEGAYLPEVFVHDSGPRRAAGFWDRVPFVRFGGYGALQRCREWDRAYLPPGAPVQREVQGYDLFVSFNGTMDAGQSLDAAEPGIPTNWFEPWFMPKDHAGRVADYQRTFGKYAAVAFWDKGFYAKWLAHFGQGPILRTLRYLADKGLTVVVMGAEWDRGALGSQLAASDSRFVDLVGETTFDEMVALVDGAAAVFGHPAGNTMLGTYLRRPTALLWGNTFPSAFRVNACPPNANYAPIDVRGAHPGTVATTVSRLLAQ